MGQTVGPGLLLGGFRLDQRVGVGGMGEVWRARNVKSDKFVRAIKVIKPELAADEAFHKRFLREAEYLELLQHPNILRVENIGEEAGMLFMVMELLQGVGVDAWLDDKKAKQTLPTVGEACGLMMQVLTGVEHAHRNGIVHRDLKPPNFFLTSQGLVKVLDFGIARHGDAKTRVTMADQGVPGSPAYYAPEFSEGHEASPASDVYALGISLFELLAGRWPFLPGGGSQEHSALSLLIQHATKPMPDVRAFRADVPEALATLIQRAGAKNPAERPAAEAFRLALMTHATGTSGVYAAVTGAVTGSHDALLVTPPPQPQLSTSLGLRGMADPQRATPAGDPLRTSFQVKSMAEAARGQTPAAVQPVSSAAPTQPLAPARKGPPLALLLGVGAVVAVAAVGGLLWSRSSAAAASTAGTAVDAGAPVVATAPPPPEGTALIPAGTYRVGGSASPFEGPEHPVTLAGFVIDKSEVSVGAARAYLVANPGVRWLLPPPAADAKPISNVAVDVAQAYCAWHLPGGRLPSEEEWEAAARGATGRSFPWGNEPKAGCVHEKQGSSGLSIPVAANDCGATPEGVRQLLGNVAEWTQSHPSLYPGSSAPFPPVFNKPDRFVVRGGSFDENGMGVSVTARGVRRTGDADKNFDVGFRCAAPWPPDKK